MRVKVLLEFKTKADNEQDAETLMENLMTTFVTWKEYQLRDLKGVIDEDDTVCENVTLTFEK